MFNHRPNPLLEKQSKIDELQSDLDQARAFLMSAQRELEQHSIEEPASEHSLDELMDQLECAKMNVKDHDSILCGLTSPLTREAFRNKCRVQLYNYLLKLQKIDKAIAQMHVANLTICIMQMENEGVEQQREELINCIHMDLDKKPLDDWRCQRYLNVTANKPE